jgi:hypothetical protein
MPKSKKKAVKVRDLKPSKDPKGGMPNGPPSRHQLPSGSPQVPLGPPNRGG